MTDETALPMFAQEVRAEVFSFGKRLDDSDKRMEAFESKVYEEFSGISQHLQHIEAGTAAMHQEMNEKFDLLQGVLRQTVDLISGHGLSPELESWLKYRDGEITEDMEE